MGWFDRLAEGVNERYTGEVALGEHAENMTVWRHFLAVRIHKRYLYQPL